MVNGPQISLKNIFLSFGEKQIFEGLNLLVQPRDRIALVGRNGSGKSTLLKVLQGLVIQDEGERILSKGLSVGYMEQDPNLSEFVTLKDYVCSGVLVSDYHEGEKVAQNLGVDLDMPVNVSSGGERRRAALTKLIAENHDIMLLDEPTNHLDVEAIEWLEAELKGLSKSFIVISHDRKFLSNLTNDTIWVDRGKARRCSIGFGGFEAWRDKIWHEEDEKIHKLNRKIRSESRWAVEGISARRKRNQGRLRNLEKLRAERQSYISRTGLAKMKLESRTKSGQLVLKADKVSKSFGEKCIIRNFSIQIRKGDRIGIVGPNGIGKSTLLKILLGEVIPDLGTAKLGSNLIVAKFDQMREQLNLENSLWQNLTDDPTMKASGKAGQIMVRGKSKHVAGYLKEFLFSESQLRSPVKSLSGGEKARLLLAKLMARESNLLILDEPTNDLDLETLDLLQEVIAEYEGTVLLISHDRDFLNRTVDTSIILTGQGEFVKIAGSWEDYNNLKAKNETQNKGEYLDKKKNVSKPPKREMPSKAEFSFVDKHRLDEIPNLIDRLEYEIKQLETFLSDSNLYLEHPNKFEKASAALIERQAEMKKLEDEWFKLEEKALR
ncbi:MAG: ABC-F family ATP-binding cassette domain-containing protein [Paracoccaceae bacterium]|jgi:ATP-binding cassette subfamily F protein uup|tara:strand:+ start:1203 stop:3020 length:1818 start_codon:yes stop_codon:yes gene_type:complete